MCSFIKSIFIQELGKVKLSRKQTTPPHMSGPRSVGAWKFLILSDNQPLLCCGTSLIVTFAAGNGLFSLTPDLNLNEALLLASFDDGLDLLLEAFKVIEV